MMKEFIAILSQKYFAAVERKKVQWSCFEKDIFVRTIHDVLIVDGLIFIIQAESWSRAPAVHS